VKPPEKSLLRARLSLAGAVLGALAAVMSALQMQDRVRNVDILTLFAGGFGAGAGLVGAVVGMRRAKAEHQTPGAPTVTAG